MTLNEILSRLVARRDLGEDEAFEALLLMAAPDASPALVGATLAAHAAKGATADEILGFSRAMRSLARRVQFAQALPIADICGTGGDGSMSLNISTGSALLAAACGAPIVKHGNRSVSSSSGSADVLEALGLQLPRDEAEAALWLDATGFTFLFAPTFHPAMKAVAAVRKALGVRTAFNLLGPLTNPAAPRFAVLGAFSLAAAEQMAATLQRSPIERAFVVHGDDGWDEPTPASAFVVFDVRPGSVVRRRRSAADFGLPDCAHTDLQGGDPATNARRLAAVLRGAERSGHRDALIIGAALLLEANGMVDAPQEGAKIAAAALDDGRAARLVDSLVRISKECRHEVS
jgi:anthranilate phosphoribosyltransferase